MMHLRGSRVRHAAAVLNRPARGSLVHSLGRRMLSTRKMERMVCSAGQMHFSTNKTKKSKSAPAVWEDETSFIIAAFEGDAATMKALAPNVDINKGDYDLRTAMHLAAAEGNLEIIKFLIAAGAEVNVTDRQAYTPLEAALRAKQDECVKYLREHGGTIAPNRKDSLINAMLSAASVGDIVHLERLVAAGASVHEAGVYDKRTPIHLAASEGQVACVEYLARMGADVNAADRFGNTPLDDAYRGVGRNFKAAVQVLKEYGAVACPRGDFVGPPLAASIQQSLSILCERRGFTFAEAWIPARDNTEFVHSQWYSAKPALAGSMATFAEHAPVMLNAGANKFAEVYSSLTCSQVVEPTDEDWCGREELVPEGYRANFTMIPIGEDTCHAIICLFGGGKEMNEEELADFRQFATRLVAAGVFGGSRPEYQPDFPEIPDIPEGQQQEVFRKIVTGGVFNANMVYNEVEYFYGMGLQSHHFNRFDADILAHHLHGYIAAKKSAATTGNPEHIWLHIENDPSFLGPVPDGGEQLLLMIPDNHKTICAAEARVESRIACIPRDMGYSLEYCESEGPIHVGGKARLGIYVLQTHEFANKNKIGELTTDIWETATDHFLNEKTQLVRERYQYLINQALGQLAPVSEVYPIYRDGTTPIMFAFAQGAGTSTSYMGQLTELLKQNNLLAKRKFIETFANGIIVYSLYIEPHNTGAIPQLLRDFSLLHLVPTNALTPHFLSGRLATNQYTYCSAAGRFAYYFINQRSEEFEALMHHFSGDTTNMNRLRLLHTSLRREAVSQQRLSDVMIQYSDVMADLSDDFERRVTTDWAKDGAPGENTSITKRILAEASNTLDAQVLNAFAMFNLAVVKTNMYKSKKAALCFRLNPEVLAEGADWPSTPYAMFFVVGSDFQGFHLRFQDVSRGGIRLIRSRDRSHYLHNLATQFAENYGLAYTQNKKNKDIPEFGSKGTILLNEDMQGNGFLAFKKYISGLLDTILDDPEIMDNYGLPELLFLGPDEGTAEMMEWAALYAKHRGYPYWRSLTTGKPPNLGGIPHDTYGMTTRSVHRYVLGCLKHLGLKESETTKIQTGGPDGDLGSNEILISCDKTIAIIDGSGVLYDPAGLDRTELTRLAKKRVMIEQFASSKLGPGGFKVLTTDVDVTLPDGELVGNGTSFRNDFHLHPLATADLFVPCGGRPESVRMSNVKHLFDEAGKPKFKIVVEGANLFLTNDARAALESAGVLLMKDASTNKGGVTSSSLEVFAGLALDELQFKRHMTVLDPSNPPRFYREYVQEIQRRLEADADLEFECLMREMKVHNLPSHLMTDHVSDKINNLNSFVTASSLWDNKLCRENVLRAAVPKTMQQLLSLETIVARVPDNYLKAIFAAYLASRYVYKYGTAGNEFNFFEFMQPFLLAPPPKTNKAK